MLTYSAERKVAASSREPTIASSVPSMM